MSARSGVTQPARDLLTCILAGEGPYAGRLCAPKGARLGNCGDVNLASRPVGPSQL